MTYPWSSGEVLTAADLNASQSNPRTESWRGDRCRQLGIGVVFGFAFLDIGVDVWHQRVLWHFCG
jgi:hypothetical protein